MKEVNSIPKVKRDSNLELFRIIVMLLIIAHHYVVNSGLTWGENPIGAYSHSLRSLFLLLFGAWGKTGINCFVLITGFFMCKSNISLRKYVKLTLEVIFYRLVIYVIFCFADYEVFSFAGFMSTFSAIDSISTGFTSCFLVFYLFIPFLNILIKNINEKQHLILVALCGFTYIVLGTIRTTPVVMNYVTWFMVLYLIASYIRCYPHELFQKTKIWGWLTVGCIFLSSVSIWYLTMTSDTFSISESFYYLSDCNKIMAVLTSISSFLFFKNIRIPYSKTINLLGATTFGVLQIHANSDAMRTWLWQDLLQNVRMFYSDFMPIHALASVIGVFAICAGIDILRTKCMESPLFNILDSKFMRLSAWNPQ